MDNTGSPMNFSQSVLYTQLFYIIQHSNKITVITLLDVTRPKMVWYHLRSFADSNITLENIWSKT